ncbi:MAG TPA: SpoIIE family protein phosphatase [Nocardioides sp.]|nr:SpoIIE family protein phosphatase [Nocardioides sp.]
MTGDPVNLDPERVRAAFDESPQVLALLDAQDLRVVALNRACRRLVGDGPLGRSLTEWRQPAGRQLLARCEEARDRAEAVHAPAWRFDRAGADGVRGQVWLDVTVTPLLEDGTCWALLGSARDVTDLVGTAGPAVADQDRADGRLVAHVQDAVLPAGLPVPQGVRLAARYLLAPDDLGCGGDWFDAVPLPHGGVALVVGDVVGHGVDAAVLMGELKVLFEQAVHPDGDLTTALDTLERHARRAPEARAATVCAARLDRSSRVLEYVTAGHPPPVLVSATGEVEYLPPSGAGPLASGLPHRTARRQLRTGDVVLLHSDGLVGRPGRSPAQNTVDLLRAASDACRTASDEPVVDRVCRVVLDRLTAASGYEDDITLLAVQVVPDLAPLALRLPAEPTTVRAARASLDDWLAPLGVSTADRTGLQQALGELLTNVVEHAYVAGGAGRTVSVDVRLTDDGVVELDVADTGAWRDPQPSERGRGLSMARQFLDELSVDPGASGTVARGRQRITHPAALLRGASTASGRAGWRSRGRVDVLDDAVHLGGPVDYESAEDLRAALARASLGGVRAVTVDLTEAELLCSAAVQALYDARASGTVGLVAPFGSPAQRVLDLVGLPYEQR